MNSKTTTIPFIEAYRPKDFNSIVLDKYNKIILKKIISSENFPNLLFYGPPGTGKTTTIINLINEFQEKYEQRNKELIIHLNASDERGIDIIRNLINQFVSTKSLIKNGIKFVILDEVDYMTDNAQKALRYLLQNYPVNVRFCLICNYISRIDEGLQNEFLKLRFNQLPKEDIIIFLKNIVNGEKLNISDEQLNNIQNLYKSDIRSMINFIQTNYDNIENISVITNIIWENLYNLILNKEKNEQKNKEINKIETIKREIYLISINFNIDIKNIIKDFLNFIVINKKENINLTFLNFVENIIHFEECNNNIYLNYCINKLMKIIK